uniref:ATP synthase subunit delta n=1 Tax=Anthurium amnicola TaxID=1678845 RepID=A0A1D1YWH8_9ARAE
MEFHGFPAGGCADEMPGHAPARMKRKDLEDVYDDFSEFSLSSPARKIRRLDAELPPIMEEEETAAPLIFGQPLPKEQLHTRSLQLAAGSDDVEPSLPLNEERAIVLYKPVNMPLLDFPCPSNVFLNVDPDMIASFKNGAFWQSQPNLVKTREEEAESTAGSGKAAVSSCLAVVPWMPSHHLPEAVNAVNVMGVKNQAVEESMASEGAEDALMEIEVEGGQANGVTTSGPSGLAASEGLQHWQQHCMTPQAFSGAWC